MTTIRVLSGQNCTIAIANGDIPTDTVSGDMVAGVNEAVVQTIEVSLDGDLMSGGDTFTVTATIA